jgi:DNA-binding IclR family transcriptional regulator
MQNKPTARQQHYLDVIDQYYQTNGRNPTCQELADEVGVDRQSAYLMLERLRKNGFSLWAHRSDSTKFDVVTWLRHHGHKASPEENFFNIAADEIEELRAKTQTGKSWLQRPD